MRSSSWTTVILTMSILLISALADETSQVCAADGTCPTSVEEEDDDDNSSTSTSASTSSNSAISRSEKQQTCADLETECQVWYQQGECESNPAYMWRNCPRSCGVCFGLQQDMGMDGTPAATTIFEQLQHTKQYVDIFTANETMKPFWNACQESLQHTSCLDWAAVGECDANPAFMHANCVAACHCCDLLDIRNRCPLSEAGPNVWDGAGLVEAMFQKITTAADPAAVTQSSASSRSWKEDADLTILSQPPDGPWVVTIDNFLSEEETTRLKELGENQGYDRSYGVGGIDANGKVIDIVSTGRTSSNTWCQGECSKDEIAIRVTNRIADLTNVPARNHEHLQLLKYDVGQFYYAHHDYISIHTERQPGVRILTVFMYLNDVEAGGGTAFPKLNNLTVMPKRGRVLIWPSVLDEDPHAKDPRTEHEALKVEAGLKFAANAWIHQRDYKNPHEKSCQ